MAGCPDSPRRFAATPIRRELEGSCRAHRGPDRILYNINRPCEPPPRSCELIALPAMATGEFPQVVLQGGSSGGNSLRVT